MNLSKRYKKIQKIPAAQWLVIRSCTSVDNPWCFLVQKRPSIKRNLFLVRLSRISSTQQGHIMKGPGAVCRSRLFVIFSIRAPQPPPPPRAFSLRALSENKLVKISSSKRRKLTPNRKNNEEHIQS